MSVYAPVMQSLVTALQAASPLREVTRDLKDFAERSSDQLFMGVFTLIAHGIDIDESDLEWLNVLLVGQCEMPDDKTPPSAIEEAELQMIDDVRRFALNSFGVVHIVRGNIRQSAQVDAPYGWISMTLRVGPFDMQEPANLTSMQPFLLFHAESQTNANLTPEIITEEVLPQ